MKSVMVSPENRYLPAESRYMNTVQGMYPLPLRYLPNRSRSGFSGALRPQSTFTFFLIMLSSLEHGGIMGWTGSHFKER